VEFAKSDLAERRTTGGTAFVTTRFEICASGRDVIPLSSAITGDGSLDQRLGTDMKESSSVCESCGMVPHRY
jgi:hypothetical protein